MPNNNGTNGNRKEERKYRVLQHVIHEYVATAVPVSSKIVSQRMKEDVSSATIRNVMAELEEEGHIEQRHISAGRIPTHSGYRRYVDRVKDAIKSEKEEMQRLAFEYTRRASTINEIIKKTTFLISRELHNPGIVMWPSIEDLYLKRIELVKIKAETVLAVLVTATNAVKNYIIKLDEDLEKAELERVENYINTNCEHAPLSSISENLKGALQDVLEEERQDILRITEHAQTVINSIVQESIENEVYWEGLDYFMDEPESLDIDVTRKVLRIFSEGGSLARIMKQGLPDKSLKVYIGAENASDMLDECSVVTCGYTLHGRTAGRIGVIGPVRMNYKHALRTINCLSDLISLKLTEIDG